MSEENTEQNRQGKTTDDLVIAKRQWERVRSRLRAELGEATFNSWFRHLEILKATATSITIQVPTKFIGSWIETNYLKRILGHWKKENDTISKINVSIQPAMHQPATQPETISRVVTDSRSSQPVQNTQVNHAPTEERGQDVVGGPLVP